MRHLPIYVIAPILLLAVSACNASADSFHYVGEVKLSTSAGQPIGSQVILLEKTYDRDGSVIVERAVVVDATGKADERTMRLQVKQDNTFTLSDEAKTVEGTGTLFGPPWRWTYFKGTWKSTSGIIIDDENFMADDSTITARKKVSGPDGKVVMYMDMSLNRIAPTAFQILKTALLK
jgi:hypothetical protein